MTTTTNIPPPPRQFTSLAAVTEWAWQFYRAIALERRVLGGSVTVEGTAVGGTVTLDVTLPDAEYQVVMTQTAQTGSPATGSGSVKSVGRATTDFSFVLLAAPGAGNSVTLDWIVRR